MKTRGFGSPKMSPERRRELASQGGIAARDKKVAYHFTPEKAREAHGKGLQTRRAKRYQRSHEG